MMRAVLFSWTGRALAQGRSVIVSIAVAPFGRLGLFVLLPRTYVLG
jgi:hypothetical protein